MSFLDSSNQSKKNNENVLRISALASKKRSNKKKVLYSTKYPLISGISWPGKLDIRVQIDWAKGQLISKYLFCTYLQFSQKNKQIFFYFITMVT